MLVLIKFIPFFFVPVVIYTVIVMVISILFTQDFFDPSVNGWVFLLVGFFVWFRLKKKYRSMESVIEHKRFAQRWFIFGVLPAVILLGLSIGFAKSALQVANKIKILQVENQMSKTEARHICKESYISAGNLKSNAFEETFTEAEIGGCIDKLQSVYLICREDVKRGESSSNRLEEIAFDDAVGECMVQKTGPNPMIN